MPRQGWPAKSAKPREWQERTFVTAIGDAIEAHGTRPPFNLDPNWIDMGDGRDPAQARPIPGTRKSDRGSMIAARPTKISTIPARRRAVKRSPTKTAAANVPKIGTRSANGAAVAAG